MAEEGPLYSERTWFYDVRSPARRMGVSRHVDDGMVIISFWQAETCTGTFRLPLAESARLISHLAYGMASAVPQASAPPPKPPTGPMTVWQRVLNALKRTPPPPTENPPMRVVR